MTTVVFTKSFFHQFDVRLPCLGGDLLRTISRTYDEAFRLVEADDDSGAANYDYTVDKLGRVTSKMENTGGLSTNITIDYAYDANGNRTSLKTKLTGDSGYKTDYQNSYEFDALGRLSKITQEDQTDHAVADKHVEYVYNALSQVTFINRFENTTGTEPALRTKFTYDGASRLESMQHRDVDSSSTSTLLNQYEYTYDNASRVIEIDSTTDGVSTYTFDKTGQVTDADHASGRTDETYTFDATGNRTGGDYVVSAKNRTDESTGYDYEYDKEGNRTKRTDTGDDSYEVYTFDHRNRLTDVGFYNSSDSLTKSIEYTYDMFNRMLQRTLDSNGSGSGGITKTYWAAFDGIHATLEFDGAQAVDVIARYIWGQFADDILAFEEVSSVNTEGDILWALSDQVYTVRDIGQWDSTNSEFVIANHRVYNSFGALESETDSSVDFVFGFTGKWVEEETGYTHHLNRWFDPEIGKWVSEDPIGFAGGDANISRYVSNAVLTRVDSNGLFGGPGIGNADPPGSTGAGGGSELFSNSGDYHARVAEPPSKEDREIVDDWIDGRPSPDDFYSTNYGAAIKDGAGTTIKIFGNTAVRTLTLGFVPEAIDVTDNDLGYTAGSIFLEIGIAATPGALSTRGGDIIQGALKVMGGVDILQGGVSVGTGVLNVANNGGQVTSQDVLNIAGGALSLGVGGLVKLKPKPTPRPTSCFVMGTEVVMAGSYESLEKAGVQLATADLENSKPTNIAPVLAGAVLATVALEAKSKRDKRRKYGDKSDEREEKLDTAFSTIDWNDTEDETASVDAVHESMALVPVSHMSPKVAHSNSVASACKFGSKTPAISTATGFANQEQLPGHKSRKRVGLIARLAVLSVLVFAAFGFLRENKNHRGDEGVRQNSTVTHVNSDSQNHLIPIEQVQLGQRVVTDISDWQRHKAVDPSDQPSWDLGEVDQYSWRQISFDAQSTFGDIVSIQLLRPLGWIDDQGVAIGNTIHLTLDGLGVDGPAKVLAVSDCPTIEEGVGQVVTGKFTHSRDGIMRIYIAGAASPIRITDNHLVYSVKDSDFVAVEELEVGDQLEGADGPISIVQIERETTAAQVYNLEIHGEHVFRVTSEELLVHNDCGDMYHYTRGKGTFEEDGLWPDSSVTDHLYDDALQAGKELGIPTPDRIVPIRRGDHFVPNSPPIVQPSNRYPGGGTDFTNPNRVPPGDIRPSIPFGGGG